MPLCCSSSSGGLRQELDGWDELALGGVVKAKLGSDGIVTRTSLTTGACVVEVISSYGDAHQYNPFGEEAVVDEDAWDALRALFDELRETDPVSSVPCEAGSGRFALRLHEGSWIEWFGSGTSALTALGTDGSLMAGRPLRLWRGAEELRRDEVARLLGLARGSRSGEDDHAWAERVAEHLEWMTHPDSTPGALTQYGGSLGIKVGPDEPERLKLLA